MSEDRVKLIAIDPMDSFYRHGMSGMAITAPDPTPAPLLHRCECGRVISNNKARCKACHEALLQSIAAEIPNRETLDAVLAESPDPKTFLEALRPFLSFPV